LQIRDDETVSRWRCWREAVTGNYGLRGMRERAAEIGVKLSIRSTVGVSPEVDPSAAGSTLHHFSGPLG